MISVSPFSVKTPLLQPTERITPKLNTPAIQETVDNPPSSASTLRLALSRARRDLQNPAPQSSPFKVAARQFADALVERGDRELAISVGNAMVRCLTSDPEEELDEAEYMVVVPPHSTLGQAWSKLADAVESEPFKSFAEARSLDASLYTFDSKGGLLAGRAKNKGYFTAFSHDDSEWSAASSAVLAAVKEVMGKNLKEVTFYGRDHAFRDDVSGFYGSSNTDMTDNNAILSAAWQLLRDGSFRASSGTDSYDASITQKQTDARRHLADLPLSALSTMVEAFAPLTAAQRVQQDDQALAQLAGRGMMKLLPETNDYDASVTLQNIPEYSTFNLARQHLLKALTGTVFTAFAQENELDPTSVLINPVSGELVGTVKGVITTFDMNDVSGWSDVWTEIKDAVRQMAAGAADPITYPSDNTAPLYQVMAFYNEPLPHQEDTRNNGWEQRQLTNTLTRVGEMIQNNGFKALISPLPSDPDCVAVQQRQRGMAQQLARTTLSPSPMEALAANVKATLPAQAASVDSTEDLLASAERDLAVTVHRVMLELKVRPAQAATSIVQPIPANSLFGQWHAYLIKALNGSGFTEWASEQDIDLTSLRYDPADRALIGKIKGVDLRFTANDFAQKYPKHFDALAPVLAAAQAFARPGQPITLPHANISGVPYQWVANFYNLSDTPGSSLFEQQTALMGRSQAFPSQSDNPQKIVGWLNRQKTALGDSNDRYGLIGELKNWSSGSGAQRFVVDPDSSHHPKSVTTVAAFISHNNWYPTESKADADNLLAALQTQVPSSPPLGNRWGFLSTQLPLSTVQRGALVDEMKKSIGTGTTLLNHLSSMVTTLSTSPEQALEQLLSSDKALQLATGLQTAMKGAPTPTSLKEWLLTALVLELDPTAGTQQKTVAGADLAGADNFGHSTLSIRNRLSQYLTANKAIPARLASTVSHLLLQGTAPHLLVKDVPNKVTLGSPEWFNFTAAVNRIEWTAPGATANMTYQQVMTHYNIRPISALEAQIQSFAQMNPLLEWAALNNNVSKDTYSLAQLKASQQELQAQAKNTADAVNWLSTATAPNRRDMTLKVLREKFGSQIDYERRFMLENEFAGIISGRHYSLAEIYEAGRLDESWMQEGTYVDFDSLRKKAKEADFPVINDEFDKAIKTDFNLRRRHTTTLFVDMLKKLPTEDNKSLLYGDVEFLNVEGAGSGMVMTSIYNGIRRDFAVYPTWGQIVRIADIDPSTPLGKKVSLDIDAEAFKNGTEPKSGVKSEVVLRSTDRHLLTDNNEPWPSEVSFPAVKENDAFSPAYVSGRISKLAKAMVDSTYLNKADFFNLHRSWSSNTLETATEPSDFFKALWHSLPGASSLEDLYHGQFLKAGVDLAIDTAITVATDGAAGLWNLAKAGASWAAASIEARFIERFGVKKAEAIEFKDFTATTTTQSTHSLSRLQNSQISEQTADMANGKMLLSGAQEQTRITAIIQDGHWYAYDTKTMAPYGPPIEKFVSDASWVLRQQTLSDGTTALATDKYLKADAYTIPRSNGFDIVNEGRVLRYDSRNGHVLTDLESADHFKPLEGFEATCLAPSFPGSRVKREIINACFSKVLNHVNSLDAQELQALEHVSIFPSTPTPGALNQYTIFERRYYKLTERNQELRLTPIKHEKPITYKPEIRGSLTDDPSFGFYNRNPLNFLKEETRVIKLGSISELCEDSRKIRGIVIKTKNMLGEAEKHLVIEADAGEFYYTKLSLLESEELTFKRCTSSEKDLVNAYRDRIKLRQEQVSPTIPKQLISAGKVANIDDLSLWNLIDQKTGAAVPPVIYNSRQKLQPLLDDIAITDTPTINENGEIKYEYDDNHQAVIKRREQIRKALEMDNYAAVRSEVFQTKLAKRVGADRDSNGKIFGQCAEMAAYAADLIKNSAKQDGYRTYLAQIPGDNHTIVLLSKNTYRAGEQIDWSREFKSNSITVDLWAGTLNKNALDRANQLITLSSSNLYTHNKPPATIQVEMKSSPSSKTA